MTEREASGYFKDKHRWYKRRSSLSCPDLTCEQLFSDNSDSRIRGDKIRRFRQRNFTDLGHDDYVINTKQSKFRRFLNG